MFWNKKQEDKKQVISDRVTIEMSIEKALDIAKRIAFNCDCVREYYYARPDVFQKNLVFDYAMSHYYLPCEKYNQMEFRIYPTQKVCDHNIEEAFKATIGTIGMIIKIKCEEDIFCHNQPERLSEKTPKGDATV